jgi:hypothetical protein
MQTINIKMSEDGHKMELVKIVRDIAFIKCPVCGDYERTINLKTGKLTRSRDSLIPHYFSLAKPT